MMSWMQGRRKKGAEWLPQYFWIIAVKTLFCLDWGFWYFTPFHATPLFETFLCQWNEFNTQTIYYLDVASDWTCRGVAMTFKWWVRNLLDFCFWPFISEAFLNFPKIDWLEDLSLKKWWVQPNPSNPCWRRHPDLIWFWIESHIPSFVWSPS